MAEPCRGATTGDGFLLPEEIPREYRPPLADWFVRRHRDRVVRHERAGPVPGT